MALINPFDAGYLVSEGISAGGKDVMQDIIDRLISILVSEKSELISKVEAGEVSENLLEAEIVSVLDSLEEAKKLPRDKVIKAALDSIFGYGPVESYLQAPDISDIIINSPNTVFVKKEGKKIRVPVSFGDEKRLLNFCRKVVAICGGRINKDEAEVVVTDRKRNLRIVVSIAPINVGSPSIVIRKPAPTFGLAELVGKKMMNKEIAAHLRKSVKVGETIVIAGKGGSGKTTLLGALLNEVPREERGLLIQEANEITVSHPDIISQLVKITDGFGGKSYTLFDLTRYGLLMSLDRFFIGEMKDREAFDFFNAVFTGHAGSMATVHSNSAGETIDRLVLLMKRADTDLSGEYLMELLASCLDQVVFMKNYKVYEIKKVLGYDREKKSVKYTTLFKLEEGEAAEAKSSGERVGKKVSA